MAETMFSRRHMPAAAGGALMTGSITESLAATLDWHIAKPSEAGFADDLEARLDKAVADKRIWNLHAVIVIRGGRLVLERYFEGADDAPARRLGSSRSSPTRCMICVRYRKASLACFTGSHSGMARCRRPSNR